MTDHWLLHCSKESILCLLVFSLLLCDFHDVHSIVRGWFELG